MHSEWAANIEQTTSMTHETALCVQRALQDEGKPEGWRGHTP